MTQSDVTQRGLTRPAPARPDVAWPDMAWPTTARRAPARTGVPGRADLDALATYTWMETTAIGRMAVVLAGHPDGGPGARSFARALRLAEPSALMPYVGDRISVAGAHARLRLDDCPYEVELAVGPQWAAFVADGGPVALIAGLDPLPRCVPPEAVSAYLRHARLRLGTTAARTHPDRTDHPDHPDHPDHADHPDRADHADHADRTEL